MNSADLMVIGACVLGGYLFGSLPSGLIIGRIWRGVDVRQYGSGRTGLTNVLRVLGWRAAVLVLAMDVAKASVAMVVAGVLGGVSSQVGVGLAVLIGHNWPVFAGFRGGRGVIPGFGLALIVAPPVALATFSLGVLIILLSRYASVGSLVATVSCCSIVTVMAILGMEPAPFGPLAIASGVLITFQHRDNIARLLQGTERRLGKEN